ncbi:hypothetical protein PAXINDRAFT_91724 [Paxillus involutus ATCC 200175]|uniref:Uncharacterized protein n=1 Tax=Paxillus involutus ATCC 200175 TaxID=664439 RepID=A0A0C9T5R8_PAXIN|nr:hypothetical protein PAXINDRAFT_91724 [Paxillus involutus ATCC 200175]
MSRQHRLQSATSTDAVLALVPADYRELLRDSLLGYVSGADKLCHARATIAKWQAHKAAGSLPPHLKSKVPEVQLTKGYLETADGANARASFVKKHQEFCEGLLDDSIRAKKDEISFLERVLTPAAIFDANAPAIKEFTTLLLAKTKLPTLKADEQGNLQLTGWETNDHQVRLGREVLQDFVVYVLRIINIQESRFLASASQNEKKKALQQASADVDMEDLTGGPSSSSVQSLVDKAVAAQMKKLSAPSKGKGKGKDKKGKGKAAERPLPQRTPYVPPPARKQRAKAAAAIGKGKKKSAPPQKNKGKGKGKN